MQKLKLAIVDDEKEILSAFKRLLRHDFDVFVFSSAHDFLEALEHSHFDILMSDIRMPAMDGFELMDKVKSKAPKVTRLCVSGYADMEACQNAIESGLFEFMIAKPWDNFELKLILGLFAKTIRLQTQLDEKV